MSAYGQGLERNAANYAALTPVSFLAKAAAVYPERIAVIHGPLRRTWRETDARCRCLASALAGETQSGPSPESLSKGMGRSRWQGGRSRGRAALSSTRR